MKTYTPIDCNYYDRLEALATMARVARIEYRTDSDDTETVDDIIVNVFSRNGAEYISLKSGLEIRLDYLIAVDGHINPADPSCQVPKR